MAATASALKQTATDFVRMVGDRILVQPIEEGRAPDSLIVIPESAKEKSNRARIVALGNGRRRQDGSYDNYTATDAQGRPTTPLFRVGDEVLLTKYGGADLIINNETYRHICGEDIICVLIPQGGK